MELNSLDRKLPVADAHDLSGFIARGFGLGRHDKISGQTLTLNNEAVIAHHLQRIRQAAKDALTVMANQGSLAMHGDARPDHAAAIDVSHALHSETYAEQRNTFCRLAQDFGANSEIPRISGVAGTGRQYNTLIAARFLLRGADLVIAEIIELESAAQAVFQ